MKIRGTLLGGAAALLLAAPAGAATVATDKPCYLETEPMAVAGQGFAPGTVADVQGAGVFGSTPVDAAGNFGLQTAAPALGTTKPTVRRVTLTASDGVNAAEATIRVSTFRADTKPRARRPGTVVKWRVSGFPAGAKVWAHYVHGGKQQRRVSFGRMPNNCGVLTRRLRQLPIDDPARGKWRIQLDTKKRYSAKTPLKLVMTGTVTSRVVG